MELSSFQSGNYWISVFDSIKSDELAGKWDVICPPHLNSSYLLFLEDTISGDLEFRYILVEKSVGDNKSICALFYFQLLRFTSKNIRPTGSLLLSALSSVVFALKTFRINICGNLFAVNFPAVWFDKEKLTDKDMLSILNDLIQKEKSDLFILKDLEEKLTAENMDESGFKEYPSDLTMTLNINQSWKSIDDYIADLSKNYRKRAMKILNAGKEIVRKEFNASDIEKDNPQIIKLFEEVASMQTVRMGQISDQYFYEYKKRFPEKFFLVGYYFKNNLIGFTTYIDRDHILEMHYIGINYRHNRGLMMYFNMLFDVLKMALERNAKQLELGRTAREAKANLGAVPLFFNDYYMVKGWLTKSFIGWYSNNFQKKMGSVWKDRHPFHK